MAETPPDNCKKENGQTCYFLRIIVVIALITIAVYYFFFINYSKNQEDIVALHEQYYDNIEKTIASGITIKDSCYYINDLVLSQMKEEQNNLKALLELQYSKQQADMTVLSTWAAVLTIVFLIFSLPFQTVFLRRKTEPIYPAESGRIGYGGVAFWEGCLLRTAGFAQRVEPVVSFLASGKITAALFEGINRHLCCR